MNPDREYTQANGKGSVRLHGRSLMFVRNVGHLMTNPAILYKAADGSTKEIPEGILDAMVTVTCALADLQMKKSSDERGSVKVPRGRNDAPVKLEEVAKEAGVSPSTVSRIMNGTASVSEAKKKAVDDAIAKLGFVPNPVARGLAGGRTWSVGVITQAIDSPFYGVALRGIEDELDPAGYCPLFVSGHWNSKTEARCIEVLHSRRVDGIIVLTGRLADQALKVCAKRTPLVVRMVALTLKV